MEPRMWRMLVAVVVMLVLALAAFTLMLRRYQRELQPAAGGPPPTRLVRPSGAPPLPAHVQAYMAGQGIVTDAPPAVTSVVIEGVGQVDVGGTAKP